MKALGIAALMFGVSCGGGGAKPAAPAPQAPASPPPTVVVEPAKSDGIPATPAGTTLRAWLAAFNGGDEQGLKAFVDRYKGPESAEELMGFRKQTGGFELVAILKSEPTAVTFHVKEKGGPTEAVGWMTVKTADPAEIEAFNVFAIPPGMAAKDMNISVDAATRTRVIDAAVARLNEYYVYPDLAKKMGDALREHQKQGAYDAINDATVFAKLLTAHLRAVSKDLHLGVWFTPKIVPEKEPEPTPEDKAKMRAHFEKINCGFEKAEKLDGNIGYVKFNMFADPEICGPRATAALGSLGEVDALIFDLRDNGGGQPAMVAFVSSYLFAKRTHLNDLYDRKQNKTEKFWTKPDVPGTKFVKQPVYVLTSKKTFSGAEEFSYNLKNLKRATIVGEVTGGGAHPTTSKRLDEHFMLGVPFARAINPITKKNWEGTGVEPDVKVPAGEALDTAKKLAAERLAKQKQKPKR
ncbi:MAG: S41 family peptidase [Myxococcota bacterium]|nr:S41 family peptidase [Myxococcota bacterium]